MKSRLRKKLLLYLGALFFSLILGVVGVTYWALRNPAEFFRISQKLLLPHGMKVSWQSAKLDMQDAPGMVWKVYAVIDGLVVERVKPKTFISLKKLSSNLTITLGTSPRVEIHDLTMEAGEKWNLEFSEPKNVSASELVVETTSYFKQLRKYISIQQFVLPSQEVQLNAHQKTVELKLRGQRPKSADQPQVSWWGAEYMVDHHSGQIAADFRSDNLGKSDPFVKIQGYLMNPNYRGEAEADFTYHNKQLKGKSVVKGKGLFEKRAWSHETNVDFALTSSEMAIGVQKKLDGFNEFLSPQEPVKVEIKAPQIARQWFSPGAGTFKLTAPVVALARPDTPLFKILSEECQCEWPQSLMLKVEGELRLFQFFSEQRDQRQVADWKISLSPIKNSLVDTSTSGKLQIIKEGERFIYAPELDVAVKFSRIESLRNVLKRNAIQLPDIFKTLSGVIDLQAKGPVAINEAGVRWPMKLNVSLADDNITIDFQSSLFGKRNPQGRWAIEGSAEIDDLKLDFAKAAEAFGVLAWPAKNSSPASNPNALSVSLVFDGKTTKSGSVKLISDYVKPHVPLTADVGHSEDGSLQGGIYLERFQMNYQRRLVTLDQMRILLAERNSANLPIDGRVHLEQPIHRLHVDISGTMRSPSISLRSEPAMDRSDMYAIFLFYKSGRQLAPEERRMAEMFENAVTGRAVGLAGLWAIASSTVTHFDYEETNKTYKATLRLLDGRTVSIGTNWEQQIQNEVEKRISRKWMTVLTWVPSPSGRGGQIRLGWLPNS